MDVHDEASISSSSRIHTDIETADAYLDLLELAAREFLNYCALDDLCRLAISCPLFHTLLSSPDHASNQIWRNAYKRSERLMPFAEFRRKNYPDISWAQFSLRLMDGGALHGKYSHSSGLMNAGDLFGMDMTITPQNQIEGSIYDIYEYSETSTKFSTTATCDGSVLKHLHDASDDMEVGKAGPVHCEDQVQKDKTTSHTSRIQDVVSRWIIHFDAATGDPYLLFRAQHVTRKYRGYDAECNPVSKEIPVAVPFTVKVSELNFSRRTDCGYRIPLENAEAWVVRCDVFDAKDKKVRSDNLTWKQPTSERPQ
eukprot:m.181284 g.181284  ORF g.181284 m.181284 type:complete len:311 (-) comp18447_c0_seq2:856-1788(-)